MTSKTMYDSRKGVDEYVLMAKGYNGRSHVGRLHKLLPEGSKVLELGMGPGVDFEMLAAGFHAVGSDLSQVFLDRYAEIRPDAELLRLDAVSIDTPKRFNAIYSNKVLHHLTAEELQRSLSRQAEVLRYGGVLLHGLWAGTGVEVHQGLRYQRYACGSFAALVPSTLNLIECESYQEMSKADSIRVVLSLKPEKP